MSEDTTGGWGCTFHRHFGSNAIHRDGGGECDQPGTPRQVYVFDPDVLAEHDAEVAAKALTDFADAHRFPSEWAMFRRLADGSSVTVGDLLRETAARIRREATP